MLKKGVLFLNTVEPIREMDLVLDVADYLRSKNERDYVLFMFGIYTGLRISDILKLRVRDVREKDYVYIRENKTGKEKRFPINAELKPVITSYIQGKKDFEYLFKSPNFPNKAISRQQAYNILSDAGKAFGLSSIGTHTLRKTFGYHMYQQTHDAVTIKDILNHSHLSETLRYIGINQDNKDKAIMGLSFKKGCRK
jgi:integrase